MKPDDRLNELGREFAVGDDPMSDLGRLLRPVQILAQVGGAAFLVGPVSEGVARLSGAARPRRPKAARPQEDRRLTPASATVHQASGQGWRLGAARAQGQASVRAS